MKIKNLSFNLSAYLIISEIVLAAIIIIISYSFTRRLVIENYFYKLQYRSEEAISPIKNSMVETKLLIDNFTTEFEKSSFVKYPEIYAKSAFRVKSGIIAFRYAVVDEKDTTKFKTDLLFYREGDSIKNDWAGFYRYYLKVGHWMNEAYSSGLSEWSSPIYSENRIDGDFKQVLVYCRPFVFNSGAQLSKAVVFCTISIDNELKLLRGLDKQISGIPILLTDKGALIYPYPGAESNNVENILSQIKKNGIDLAKELNTKKEGSVIIHPELFHKKKSLAMYWPVSQINWLMIAVLPTSVYMAEMDRILFLAILIILFMASISAAVSVYFSSKLVSPIALLAKDSRKFMEEEGVEESNWSGEVETLSKSIEMMKGKLKSYEMERLKTEQDNVELERELKLARDIEMGIIPTKFPLFPDRKDFDCYGKLIPAKIVGGDLFDFFLLDDNNLFVSICDTLGKGIPAAMFAVATRTLIRNIANPITRIGKMMELLNEELSIGQESDMFVTVIMGRFNLKTGEFSYCNAGHPRPIIIKSDHQVLELDSVHGFPIGVRNKQTFVETTIKLAPGESFIAYTDGVTEEVDKHGDFFGKERLLSILQAQNTGSPEKIVREILKALEKFRGKMETYDDTTVLAFKYYGNGKEPEHQQI